MKPLEDLIEKLENLPQNMEKNLPVIMDYLEPQITQLNRDQLKKQKVDRTGNSMGNYSPATERITKGKKTGPITLFDTGAFQRSIQLKQKNKGEFVFDATDPKWRNKLQPQERFSKALGLVKENEQPVGVKVKNKVFEYLRTLL